MFTSDPYLTRPCEGAQTQWQFLPFDNQRTIRIAGDVPNEVRTHQKLRQHQKLKAPGTLHPACYNFGCICKLEASLRSQSLYIHDSPQIQPRCRYRSRLFLFKESPFRQLFRHLRFLPPRIHSVFLWCLH